MMTLPRVVLFFARPALLRAGHRDVGPEGLALTAETPGPAGLWRHPDFLRLWSGQTISQFGSQVTQLALPLTAAITLQVSALEMGVLGAVEFAPFLLFGLVAGVWVDRQPRRRTLIAADLGRALLLGLIPLAALFGVLRIELLYAVGFLTGVLTVFFDVAYQSYLPILVERSQLVEGNARLEVSRSVAQVVGPGLGGTLVQLVSAPVAIAVDALSFLASAGFLAGIGRAEPPPRRGAGPGVWADIRARARGRARQPAPARDRRLHGDEQSLLERRHGRLRSLPDPRARRDALAARRRLRRSGRVGRWSARCSPRGSRAGSASGRRSWGRRCSSRSAG